MPEMSRFIQVTFHRFKAFRAFNLHLRQFNVLVGPNNAGKSTILAALKILAAAMRKANNRKPEIVRGPYGETHGYSINLEGTSVAEENIFYNYNESEPATVSFKMSNGNELLLYFPEVHACNLIARPIGRPILSPAAFRSQFHCPIGFVPILGPVEQHENLYDKEAARLALFNYRAARNFRNIWYHYPEEFEPFRAAIQETWPGMDIEPPKPTADLIQGKRRLYMFCPEERIPREIFWAGFGFQVWCQMLTHVIQSKKSSIFLIDEPDIYLHAELQRQLVGLLRSLGPDVVVATHSVEIITESEPDDILIVNKKRKTAKRIKRPAELLEVFSTLGTGLNPTLTQLAKTRRAIFVEGKDFQILGKMAAKLGFLSVGNRSDFAVIAVEGFNPERIRTLKAGMETTLGGEVRTAAILDRDYRSDKECDALTSECESFCDLVAIHGRKEIENFLLIAPAIDRAASRRVTDHARRGGTAKAYTESTTAILETFTNSMKNHILSRYLADRKQFERKRGSGFSEATINEAGVDEFENLWTDAEMRLRLIPGKEALSAVNQKLQERYDISVTPTSIIEAMLKEEIPAEMVELVDKIATFAGSKVSKT